ncbi:hypothetical protein UFOVP4_2 [uncultured Caudovirales phage]|uniref:Uncharacterized protein n=1 Tax=uncultured Caudovirales phage TaxID=2100421 RepID=A0A6J7VNK2_9CAUD|nr:hypothetical protein UFOVP4_2 [uncultured Caudovirales phage]CAB4241363.1 hypothetical protein UFOVP64_57 [uncultured Caudovirales phage]CAB5078972.1 hypothetical protein UFOVP145_13 [uncultured Caudovirales phage]
MTALTPVDYDPFAAPAKGSAPKLTPVDYDPFAAQPASAPAPVAAPPAPPARPAPPFIDRQRAVDALNGDPSAIILGTSDSNPNWSPLAAVPQRDQASTRFPAVNALNHFNSSKLTPSLDRFSNRLVARVTGDQRLIGSELPEPHEPSNFLEKAMSYAPSNGPQVDFSGAERPNTFEGGLAAASRASVRGVLPSAAGWAGFGAGATAISPVAAAVALASGPFGVVTGPATEVVGGLGGAFAASAATEAAQKAALSYTPQDALAVVGQDNTTLERDSTNHPIATFAGNLAPGFLFGRPTFKGAEVASDAGRLARIFANPVASAATTGALGGVIETGSEVARGEKIDPAKIGIAAVVGAALNKPTALGSRLQNFGQSTVSAGAKVFSNAADAINDMLGRPTRASAYQAEQGFATAPQQAAEGDWQVNDQGIMTDPSGKPFSFGNDHVSAAKWAVLHRLGGDFDIAIISGPDGQSHITLQRRNIEGSSSTGTAADPAGQGEVSGQLPAKIDQNAPAASVAPVTPPPPETITSPAIVLGTEPSAPLGAPAAVQGAPQPGSPLPVAGAQTTVPTGLAAVIAGTQPTPAAAGAEAAAAPLPADLPIDEHLLPQLADTSRQFGAGYANNLDREARHIASAMGASSVSANHFTQAILNISDRMSGQNVPFAYTGQALTAATVVPQSAAPQVSRPDNKATYKDPAFKRAFKGVELPHVESSAAFELTKGWHHGTTALSGSAQEVDSVSDLTAELERIRPTMASIRDGGTGFNPLQPYFEGFLAAITGERVQVRTKPVGETIGVEQAYEQILQALNGQATPAPAPATPTGDAPLKVAKFSTGEGPHMEGMGLSEGTVATLSDGTRILLTGVPSGAGSRPKDIMWKMRLPYDVDGRVYGYTDAELGAAKNRGEAAKKALEVVQWMRTNPGQEPVSYLSINTGNALSTATPAPAVRPAPAAPAPTAPAPASPEPEKPIEPPLIVGKKTSARIPATKEKVELQFEIHDLTNIRHAEGDLQNRDRSRPETQEFLRDFTKNFDPEILGEDQFTDRGAPIINKDNVVLSGNGRMMGLDEIYKSHPEKAAAYRKFLTDQGYDVSGIDRPVLVRRATGDLDERAFVTGSNDSDIAALSPPEQARQDAKDVLSNEVLSKYKGGDLNASINSDFVSAFIAQLSGKQQRSLMDANRHVSVQGIERISNALLFKAYGNAGKVSETFISKALERTDDDSKTLTGSLSEAAPVWIALQRGIAAGDVDAKYDITDKILETLATVSDIKARDLKVRDYLLSDDMFNAIDPFVKDILLSFHNNAITRFKSKKAITALLRDYVDKAEGQVAGGEDMFGPVETPSAHELWKAVDKAAQGDETSTLFEKGTTNGNSKGNERRNQVRNQIAALEDEGEGAGGEIQRGSGGNADGTQGGDEGRRGELLDRSGVSGDNKGGYRDTFNEASFTNRLSIYQSAIRATGIEPSKFALLKPERKVELLVRALEDLTGIKVEIDPRLPKRSAMDQLLDAHQTLQGMAYVLGISPRALSLEGGLSLKLIAQGNFLGAFFPPPGANQIQLPGRSNSFAHEWAHALDWHLMEKLGGAGRGLSGMVRKEGAHFPPENLREAFIDLMNAMFFDEAGMAAKIMDLEKKIASTKSDKVKAAAQTQIDNFRSGRSQARDVPSRYLAGAKAFDATSEYWTSPTEMMARAMEAYVSYMAELQGFGTEFIGKGDANYRSNAEERFKLTFPKDAERLRIFEAIGNLMQQIHNEAMLGSDPASGVKPDMTDIVRLTDFDRLIPYKENGTLIQRELAAQRRQARQLERDMQGRATDPKSLVQRTLDVWSTVFFSMAGQLKMLQARNKSAAIGKIHDLLATTPGNGEYVGRTFSEAVTMRRNRNVNRLGHILKNNGLMDMEPEDERLLRDALISEDNTSIPVNIIKAAAEIRTLLDNEWQENQNAGISLGYASAVGYLNRSLDLPLVFGDETGFSEAAGRVYELVYDRDFGDSVDAIMAQEGGLSKFAKMAKMYGVDGADELRALSRQINALGKQMATSADPDAIQAKIDELTEQLMDLMGDMYDGVRSGFAEARAAAWLAKIKAAADYDFDAHSPDANYTKKRDLPPEADKLLENYYLQNPIESVLNYFGVSARRIAYAERFGAKGEKLDKLKAQMVAEGVGREDQAEVLKILNIATGRTRSGFSNSAQGFMSALQAIGTLQMLPRAVLSSLTESFTAGAAGSDFRLGIKAFAAVLSGTKSLKGRQRAELARAIGIVTDVSGDMMMEARFGGNFGNATRWDRLTSRMFERTGLTGLTRAQRTHILAASHAFLDNLVGKVLSIRGDKNADAMLQELGIRDVEAFAKEFAAKNGMPTVEDLDTKWGEDYALASRRFANMSIMEPTAMDRPQLANNPVGRVIYGITAFSQAFWRNVLKRQILMTKNTYKRTGAIDAAKHAVFGFLPAALLMVLTGTVVSMLREWLLNRDKWEEHRIKGDLMETMAALGAQRTFALGTADPFISAWFGLKYQRDLSNVMIGAFPGMILQNMQTLLQAAQRNSDKTNTTEYNATRAAYNLTVAPALSIALAATPAGPLTGPLLGLAQMIGTAPAAGNTVARVINGPKGLKTDPETGKRAETDAEYADRMREKAARAQARKAENK